MDIDEKLREQSKVLLQKLKAKQGRLQQMLSTSALEKLNSTKAENSLHERSGDFQTSQHHVTQPKEFGVKQHDGETVIKTSKENGRSRIKISKPKQIQLENKENLNQTSHSKQGLQSKDLMQDDSKKEKIYDRSIPYRKASSWRDVENETRKKVERESKAVSDKRNIIDRNVHVEGEDLVDLTKNSGLNFSYSRFDESELDFAKACVDESVDVEEPEQYYGRLQESGNDKRAARLIQESYKPKSILQTTGPKSLQKVRDIHCMYLLKIVTLCTFSLCWYL